MVMRVDEGDMEKIVEKINVKDRIQNVYVVGRIRRGYKCDINGHIRLDGFPTYLK